LAHADAADGCDIAAKEELIEITGLTQELLSVPRALPAVALPCSIALPATHRRRQRNLRCESVLSSHVRPQEADDQSMCCAAVVLHIYDVMAPMVEQVNQLLRPAGTGIFHAGVEVFGLEWSFGATQEDGPSSPDSCCGHVSGISNSGTSVTDPFERAERSRLIARARLRSSVRERRCEEISKLQSIHRASPLQDEATGIFSVSPRECGPHKYRESVAMGLTELSKPEVMALLGELAREWPSAGYDLLHRNCGHFADQFCRRLGVGAIPTWVTSFADGAATVQAGALTAVSIAASGAMTDAFHAQASHMYNKVDHMFGQAADRLGKAMQLFGGVASDVKESSDHYGEDSLVRFKQINALHPLDLGFAWSSPW